MAMWYETLVDASIVREWVVNVGRRDARTRIAHLLCEFALRLELAKLGEQTAYELPITQEQLADAVALTPVHVNRTLMKLEEDLTHQPHQARDRDRRLDGVGQSRGISEPRYLHLRSGPPARRSRQRAAAARLA